MTVVGIIGKGEDAMHEFGFIDWLRKRNSPSPRTAIGIGDDCAGYRFTEGREVLITTDMLLEGSCFILSEAGPFAVGRKALAVNLSDIAAMAGIPRAAVVSLALPQKGGAEIAQELYRGIESMAREFEVEIVGGDTNSWKGPLAISIALFGESTAKPPVKRSGARLGDWIFVSGSLGGSILGRHLDFVPKVREAIALHEAFDLHAMIDLSDGLSRDLRHICEESQCGARIVASDLPIHAAALELSKRDGISPLNHALNDGEDFELCFTVSPEAGEKIESESKFNVTCIGKIMPAGRYEIQMGEVVEVLKPKGYEHRLD